ncbi:hypothetical protein BH11CYA1_BH11CYA1_38960 [soil metagenome]
MAKRISDTANSSTIKGWHLNDSEHDDFIVGLELTSRHAGKNCAFIESTAQDAASDHARNACGHLTQNCGIAPEFRNKRIRMKTWVKSALIEPSIGRIELNIIGKWGWYCRWNGTFDNMNDRPILGESEWQQYSLVVDVPEESISMNFGLFLIGVGKMWLDEVSFEIVDNTVPLTGLLPQPTNLNFDD